MDPMDQAEKQQQEEKIQRAKTENKMPNEHTISIHACCAMFTLGILYECARARARTCVYVYIYNMYFCTGVRAQTRLHLDNYLY